MNEPIELGDYCERCGCCGTIWVECLNCGGTGGRDGEELTEEDPLWYGEDDFEKCDTCSGKGGWNKCLGDCNDYGEHN